MLGGKMPENLCGEVIANGMQKIELSSIYGIMLEMHEPMFTQFKEEEEKMTSSKDMNLLIQLAGQGEKDEFSHYDQLPFGLKEAIEKKKKQEAEENLTAAAEVIVKLMKDAKATIRQEVECIRVQRAKILNNKKKIGNIEKLEQHALKTNDWVLLARYLRGEKVEIPETID